MAFIEIERSVRKNEWSMQDLHSHPHYEIYLLKSGTRSFFLSDALFCLEAPIIIVIPPHVLHKTEGGPFERYNINVSPSYLDEFQTDVLNEKALHVIKPTPQELQKLLGIFDELSEEKKKKYEDCITRALFSYCIFTLNKLQNVKSPKVTTKSSIPPLVLKIIDYLNDHYAEKQTLDEIAERFFISKGALMYTFKKHMDCSLIDFLISLRISKAKELLIKTKKSVEEISELCGFSSANYFGLIFKRKEMLSPVQYRKHQTNKQ
ncbi:MAG: helix-turn-helix transcriptional regulator [Clostridia bacterium]|nr:helix-turn-helix transcriptional regulator [Clostridia bacterium]